MKVTTELELEEHLRVRRKFYAEAEALAGFNWEKRWEILNKLRLWDFVHGEDLWNKK